MYHLYVDETGNTSSGASNRHTQRYLSLTGVIISDDAKGSVENHFDRVRSDHFGHTPTKPIVLHRVQLNSGRGIYDRLKNEAARALFEADFAGFLGGADYSAISMTMDKVAFYYHHENWVGEPYEFCAFNMLERFCLFLKHRGEKGSVTVETRNPKQDALFSAAFKDFCENGTRYIDARDVRRMLGHAPVAIPTKSHDVIGCQMADFLCQPLLEAAVKHYLGKGKSSPWHQKIIRAAWPKLYRGKYSKLEGCGLVWRPNVKRPA